MEQGKRYLGAGSTRREQGERGEMSKGAGSIDPPNRALRLQSQMLYRLSVTCSYFQVLSVTFYIIPEQGFIQGVELQSKWKLCAAGFMQLSLE